MIPTVKNWKLALLGLLFICLFTSLGCWQLARAKEKTKLLETYTARMQQPALSASDLNRKADWRFYRIQLQGQFDNQHSFLLDNKTYHGQVGYEVYTPFYAQDHDKPFLIDRGFIPLGKSRQQLPIIQPILGPATITGLLNLPPHYSTFAAMHDKQPAWPMRIQFINMERLNQLLDRPLADYVVNLTPQHPGAFAIEWQIVIMGPEKHRGYAVQWFALALTLLILSVALNRRTKKSVL